MHPDGQVEFQFPKVSKVTLYGLLELARAQFDKMVLLSEVKESQESRGGIANLLRRKNGGH